MSAFWSYTVIGVATGAIYAITASGLVVTYATTGVFNFAHGAIGMFAAFSYWELTQNHHVQPAVAVLLVLFVEAPLLGALIEFVLMRRLHGASTERSLMVTLGLMLILVGVASTVWGTTPNQTGLPAFFAGDTVRISGVNVTVHQLIVLGVAVVVALGLWVVLRRTRTGVAMRAVVDDPDLVAMAGARPVRVARAGWITGVMLAALAGVLIAPLVNLDQVTLTLIVVNGYAAAVVGRLRNLPLTFAGGIAIGLGEAYVVGYVPTSWQSSWLPNPALALPMAFLFVVILVLPVERLRAVGEVRQSRVPVVTSLRGSLYGSGLLVAGAALGALVLSDQWRTTLSQGLVFGVIALSLVLLTGYGGQISLGQMAFVGIGAFAMAKLGGSGASVLQGWLAVLAAVGITAAVGALIALPTIRVKGLYLALATLAFAQFAYYIFFSNLKLFEDNGSVIVPRTGLPGISLHGERAELVFLAVVFALCAVAVLAIRRGTFGRRLVALSDSPAACATVGLRVRLTRLAVFALSAGLAGLGGVLYGGLQGPVSADDFQVLVSLTLLLLLVIWGVRTPGGALAAGISMAALPVLQSHVSAVSSLPALVVGIGVIAIGRVPNGLIGLASNARTIRRREPRPTAVELPELEGEPRVA
jgi:branched-chain amino acid transport system permease protein